MAQEIKNTFLKSKMNKDLDDRILPNGEYRDARNISVGRSEDNDVGALENVIGNLLMATTDLDTDGLEIIGLKESPVNDTIYVFLTNYTDSNPASPTNAPEGTLHFIYSFNTLTEEYTRLLQGEFLNFSKSNKIIGINLLETLLFWTDNRNQPRKINISLARGRSGSRGDTNTQDFYYTQEHQISVAKYNPFQSIELYTRTEVKVLNWATGSLRYITVLGDRVAELTPYRGAAVVSNDVPSLTGSDYVFIASVSLDGGNTKISFTKALDAAPSVNDIVIFIKSSMTNEDDDVTWPGDPNYLEDKFVRFSYRFKYEDNEYSLMAPFTQIAYIPKQKGYFVEGDEDAAYRSTILDWMENNVQNIGLIIPLPDRAVRVASTYKISEIDILFRQSGNLAVKVLESVSIGQVAATGGQNNSYTYDYQSRKPYRTLPEAQTVRVYDKVPVTAFSQEVAGNRIIYGNFKDKHTPPSGINYNCRISKKNSSGFYDNFIEYPNHSVKRNRTYQVGFILADKFGRQSSVILSKVDEGTDIDTDFYSGSTIYSPYDSTSNGTDVKNWFGDAIELVLNSPIQSNLNNASGTPGLYAIPQKNQTTGDGFAIGRGGTTSINGSTWIFRKDLAYPLSQNIPEVGQYLRGEFIDFVKVLTITGPLSNLYTVTTDGQVNSSYLPIPVAIPNIPDLRFAYAINDLGWYSYKIVVKQTQQDYYNVYLPGILNGYPGQSLQPTSNIIGDGELEGAFPDDELNLTAHTVLFSDNINKVPRDLSEVGPQERQFRSSVELFGRVTNSMNITTSDTEPDPSNLQYYPTINNSKNAIAHTATTIAAASDLDMSFSQLSNSESGVIVYTFQTETATNNDSYAITNVTAEQLQNNKVTVTVSGQDFIRYTIEGTSLVFPDNIVSPGSEVIVTITGNAGAAGGTAGNLTFYNIDTNPFIARLSTTEKAIGWPAEQTVNPSVTPGIHEWNMQPYLSVYETAPVESLLDIYWETTSAGYIADINSEALTGYDGITSFQNLSWDFPESKEPGDAITSFFDPYSASGVFISNTTVELISVINGIDEDVTDKFDIVIGTATPNVGKYKLILANSANNGFAFTEGSDTRDVFYFEIQSTTIEGEITTNYIGGIDGLDGALYNVEPTTLNGILPNIQLPQESSLLMSANAWTTAQITNGSSVGNPANATTNTTQLVYTMEPFDPAIPVPTNWSMDPATGQITQALGSSDVGVYTINILATDANNSAGGGGVYGALFYKQQLTITIGDQDLNDELVNNFCPLTPISTETTPPTPYLLTQPEAVPAGTGGSGFSGESSGIWYISDRVLDPNEESGDFAMAFPTGSGFIVPSGASNEILGTDNVFRVGTGAHTAGSIAMNLSILGRQADWGVSIRIEVWVRFIGSTNSNYPDGWISINNPVITELNKNNYLPLMRSRNLMTPARSTYADWPQQLNAKSSDNFDPLASGLAETKEWNTSPASVKGENSNGLGWANYIRCFNFADFSNIEGIEYAWTVIGLEGDAKEGRPQDRTVAWLTVDDLNNPSCVPWQGVNVVQELVDPTVKAFPYYISAYTNSRSFTNTEENVLYAKTPYVDYVTTLFTDKTFATVSKPTDENAPFLNYNLALNSSDYTGSLLAWNYGDPDNAGQDGEDMNLQIVSRFNTDNGNRVSNAVGSQTTASLIGNGLPLPNGESDFTFDDPEGDVNGSGYGGRLNRGYSRFKVTLTPKP